MSFCSCYSNSREEPFQETQGECSSHVLAIKKSNWVTQLFLGLQETAHFILKLPQFLVQPHAHPDSGERLLRTQVICGKSLLPRSPSHFETLTPEQTGSNVFTTDQWNFLRSHRGWLPLARSSQPWMWLPCALWERSVYPSQTHLCIPSSSGSSQALYSACRLQDRVAILFKSSLVPPAALR